MEALRRSGDLDQKSAELLHLGMLGVSKKTVSGDRFLDVFLPQMLRQHQFFGIFKLEVWYIQNHIMFCRYPINTTPIGYPNIHQTAWWKITGVGKGLPWEYIWVHIILIYIVYAVFFRCIFCMFMYLYVFFLMYLHVFICIVNALLSDIRQ